MNEAVTFRDVRLTYGAQTVLSGFGLTVERGDKVLIYGDSGTGKSSVLRMILGFVVPDEGAVIVNGEHLTPAVAWAVRREAAYVPQATDLGDGTGEQTFDWIRHVRANRGKTSPLSADVEAQLRIEPGVLSKRLADLSGGELQRVALAAALTLNRSLFLLDEPTASLDGGLKEAVVNLFASRVDWTVIAVSHDPVWQTDGRFRVVTLDGANSDGR